MYMNQTIFLGLMNSVGLLNFLNVLSSRTILSYKQLSLKKRLLFGNGANRRFTLTMLQRSKLPCDLYTKLTLKCLYT